LKAIRASAADYLLKPVDVQELIQAVERVRRRMRRYATATEQAERRWETLLAALPRETTSNTTIALPTFEGIEIIPVQRILYVEADSNYARLVLEGGDSLLVSRTLKDLEELLIDHQFLRIHHSYLVKVSRIRRYVRGDGGSVVIDNGDELSVSRRRKEDLLKILRT
ncbi:MAG: LytTR family DNA-binding domain-containing protein, partial [Saprospiraceae bacterium]|nr:LytTR family DNA-binding domain-containing protein [Saprospiraceae bacterium]